MRVTISILSVFVLFTLGSCSNKGKDKGFHGEAVSGNSLYGYTVNPFLHFHGLQLLKERVISKWCVTHKAPKVADRQRANWLETKGARSKCRLKARAGRHPARINYCFVAQSTKFSVYWYH